MKPLFGLTGNIGSGKSTVAKLLAEYPDVLVLDSDAIAKEILFSGTYANEINTIVGMNLDLANPDTRKQLAHILFNNPEILEQYQLFVHPLMWNAICKARDESEKICVVESAILLETNGRKYVDRVIMVTIDPVIQMRRLREFRNMQDGDIKARIALQWSQDEKMQYADYLIENNGTQEQLKEAVRLLHTYLKNYQP